MKNEREKNETTNSVFSASSFDCIGEVKVCPKLEIEKKKEKKNNNIDYDDDDEE